MEPVEELLFCKSCLDDARTAMIQGRTADAKASMEEAKQYFFRVYWPLNGHEFTGWVAMYGKPGDAMNKPIPAPEGWTD